MTLSNHDLRLERRAFGCTEVVRVCLASLARTSATKFGTALRLDGSGRKGAFLHGQRRSKWLLLHLLAVRRENRELGLRLEETKCATDPSSAIDSVAIGEPDIGAVTALNNGDAATALVLVGGLVRGQRALQGRRAHYSRRGLTVSVEETRGDQDGGPEQDIDSQKRRRKRDGEHEQDRSSGTCSGTGRDYEHGRKAETL